MDDILSRYLVLSLRSSPRRIKGDAADAADTAISFLRDLGQTRAILESVEDENVTALADLRAAFESADVYLQESKSRVLQLAQNAFARPFSRVPDSESTDHEVFDFLQDRFFLSSALEEFSRHGSVPPAVAGAISTLDANAEREAPNWRIFWTDLDDRRIQWSPLSSDSALSFLHRLLELLPWRGEGLATLAGATQTMPDGPIAGGFLGQMGGASKIANPTPLAPLALLKAKLHSQKSETTRKDVSDRVISWIRKQANQPPRPIAEFPLAADAAPLFDATKPILSFDLGTNSAAELRAHGHEFIIQVAVDPPERLSTAPRVLNGDSTSLSAEAHGDGVFWYQLGPMVALRPPYVLELLIDHRPKTFVFFD